jgi:hypothetical protein
MDTIELFTTLAGKLIEQLQQMRFEPRLGHPQAVHRLGSSHPLVALPQFRPDRVQPRFLGFPIKLHNYCIATKFRLLNDAVALLRAGSVDPIAILIVVALLFANLLPTVALLRLCRAQLGALPTFRVGMPSHWFEYCFTFVLPNLRPIIS